MKRYQESIRQLELTERIIPYASQTFSKSRITFPKGASPLFLARGHGARVWDIDGNSYIDWISALAALSLGYADADINSAVLRQLELGVSFSLPVLLEQQLAQMLVDLIPSAEMVRFAKNGSDVTSAAIRLARAYSGRDEIIACGYHGWHDWYIGSTSRDLGVPQAVKDCTHRLPYNQLSAVEEIFQQRQGRVAALIMEPLTCEEPQPGYLEAIRSLCDRHGALLVFDEVVTGFRLSLGGAQQYFGVTPDLTCLGKGMANGFPLSAIVGKREIMRLMEDIFFSGTFGGEAVSLVAAIATIKKIKEVDLPRLLAERGAYLLAQLTSLIEQFGCEHFLHFSGAPCWLFVIFRPHRAYHPHQMRSFFIQEMCRRGQLIHSSHNLNYSHDQACIAELVAAYREVLPLLKKHIEAGSLEDAIEGEPLEPAFKIRG